VNGVVLLDFNTQIWYTTKLVVHVLKGASFTITCPHLIFFELFAGGAIVSITTAFEQITEHIIMVEYDEEVAAVWGTIMVMVENGLLKPSEFLILL
jgi:hypothetical protein